MSLEYPLIMTRNGPHLVADFPDFPGILSREDTIAPPCRQHETQCGQRSNASDLLQDLGRRILRFC